MCWNQAVANCSGVLLYRHRFLKHGCAVSVRSAVGGNGSSCEWFGRGPGESYPDRKYGNPVRATCSLPPPLSCCSSPVYNAVDSDGPQRIQAAARGQVGRHAEAAGAAFVPYLFPSENGAKAGGPDNNHELCSDGVKTADRRHSRL